MCDGMLCASPTAPLASLNARSLVQCSRQLLSFYPHPSIDIPWEGQFSMEILAIATTPPARARTHPPPAAAAASVAAASAVPRVCHYQSHVQPICHTCISVHSGISNGAAHFRSSSSLRQRTFFRLLYEHFGFECNFSRVFRSTDLFRC